MKAEVREALGKAAYEERRRIINAQRVTELPLWEEQEERVKELDRCEAEAVVMKLAEMLIPIMQTLLTEEDIAALLASLAA